MGTSSRKTKNVRRKDFTLPATRIAVGPSRKFEAVGLERAHWSTAARIRSVFQNAFARADLPYFNPHSFRNTLVRLGQSVCQTPEEFKAWSQNLGHDKVLTTFLSYGQVESQRQAEIIRGLGARAVALILKRAARLAGIEASHLAGHSLRAGLATAAAKAGKSERSIMKQTGHRSERMVRKYVRDASLFTENAAAGLL